VMTNEAFGRSQVLFSVNLVSVRYINVGFLLELSNCVKELIMFNVLTATSVRSE